MKILTATSKVMLVCLLLLSSLFFPISQTAAKQDMKSTIDTYIENFLEEHHIPGASVAIVHENDLFYSNSWGVTGESKEKVTTQTPFTIGSISKSLTGLAIMRLIDEETIHLEDPIKKYLPWFTLKDQQATSQITIKHLLTHTSGISTYSGLSISDKESKESDAIQKNVKSLSNVKLTATPGEKYQYSNANFLILGALIEEVTHQTYSKYMEQQVFLPLNMKNAAADHHSAYKKGYLAGYQSWLGIPRKSSITYDTSGAPYGYIAASVEDMAEYIQFLSQHDHNQFLTDPNMHLYISSHVQTDENRYYGLGLRITNLDLGGKMIWHSGSTPDSRAELFAIPETGWGGVILTNKNHILEEAALIHLRNGIIDILNGEKPADIPKSPPYTQIVVMGIIGLLFVLFATLLVQIQSKKIHKRKAWRIFGIVLLILSISMIPSLIYRVGTPWHTLKVFAADIAFLTILMVILLALNGILSIYHSVKR
ncbi:serine hydrolase domain-containing protein [Oikeobacillus pervagus]|nr:serine hydrolase domain-containing protein [Oikeobacillus pervagus]